MAMLTPSPKMQFLDANGNPLIGGKLYTYAAGTNTPLATYTDAGGGTPNTNPIILDSRGEANVWLGTTQYKFTLRDSADVLIWTVDNLNQADAVTLGLFAASSGSSLVGHIDDGVSAVARTVQSKLRDVVHIKDFGAVGNGIADDASAIQAAINSLGSSGGTVLVGNDMRCVIDSNLTVNANVTLKGPHNIVGSPGNNTSAPYGSVGGAILINSSVSITLRGGASLNGLLLHRKGMTFPAPDSSSFAGTAIIVNGDDAAVFQCMILGFTKALYSSNNQRVRVSDTNIDCVNGIEIDNCADITYLSKVHCWPFATIASGGGASSLQRAGVAYKFTNLGDWTKVSDCFSYGYFRGYQVLGCNSMTFLSCGADNTGSFASSIGFDIESSGGSGGQDIRLIGCQAAAQSSGYFVSITSGINVRFIGSDAWGCTTHGILIGSGDAHIIGGIMRNIPNGISVNNATSQVYVDDVRFENATLPINVFIPNSSVSIGTNNDYGNYADGSVVTDNTKKVVRSIASADPINLPVNGDFFQITGTTSFGTVNGGWSGRMVTFKFTGNLTVNDGGASLKLNGNFATNANSTLTLVHDGLAWCEVARSLNS